MSRLSKADCIAWTFAVNSIMLTTIPSTALFNLGWGFANSPNKSERAAISDKCGSVGLSFAQSDDDGIVGIVNTGILETQWFRIQKFKSRKPGQEPARRAHAAYHTKMRRGVQKSIVELAQFVCPPISLVSNFLLTSTDPSIESISKGRTERQNNYPC